MRSNINIHFFAIKGEGAGLFVVLTFSPPKQQGFLLKMLDKLKPKSPTVTEHSALGCKYMCINHPPGGRIKWRELERITGRWAGRIVMNKDIEVPHDCRITRADTSEFEERILLATACRALNDSRCELYERQVGLVDPTGEWQWAAVELLKYCTTLIVYTKAPQRYQRFCGQMMEAYGAPVVITDQMRALDGCILVISPYQDKGQWPACPVLTLVDAASAFTINHLSLSPQQLGCDIPPGLEPLEFAAALWRFGRLSELGRLHAQACRIGGRLSDIRDCSALIYKRAVSLRSGSDT